MIKFVNAKLNLGLNIVNRRPDGYHDLETIFYPVGVRNGTPLNPEPFCDILEITPSAETAFVFTGREVDCPLEKNLVYKAFNLFKDRCPDAGEYTVRLEKHLPDGAGLGGGSADAGFVLNMLNELSGKPFSCSELAEMALKLGADCPFFIYNEPCFACGVGEVMTPVPDILSGWWCALVKPEISISTREAFAGVVPARSALSLKSIVKMSVEQWKDVMVNDFEESLFANHPELYDIKQRMYASDAVYSAMSGSGSTIFGLFRSRDVAEKALSYFSGCFKALCLL